MAKIGVGSLPEVKDIPDSGYLLGSTDDKHIQKIKATNIRGSGGGGGLEYFTEEETKLFGVSSQKIEGRREFMSTGFDVYVDYSPTSNGQYSTIKAIHKVNDYPCIAKAQTAWFNGKIVGAGWYPDINVITQPIIDAGGLTIEQIYNEDDLRRYNEPFIFPAPLSFLPTEQDISAGCTIYHGNDKFYQTMGTVFPYPGDYGIFFIASDKIEGTAIEMNGQVYQYDPEHYCRCYNLHTFKYYNNAIPGDREHYILSPISNPTEEEIANGWGYSDEEILEMYTVIDWSEFRDRLYSYTYVYHNVTYYVLAIAGYFMIPPSIIAPNNFSHSLEINIEKTTCSGSKHMSATQLEQQYDPDDVLFTYLYDAQVPYERPNPGNPGWWINSFKAPDICEPSPSGCTISFIDVQTRDFVIDPRNYEIFGAYGDEDWIITHNKSSPDRNDWRHWIGHYPAKKLNDDCEVIDLPSNSKEYRIIKTDGSEMLNNWNRFLRNDGVWHSYTNGRGVYPFIADAVFHAAQPNQYLEVLNGFCQNDDDHIAFFAGAIDNNPSTAPIKIFEDGTTEGLGTIRGAQINGEPAEINEDQEIVMTIPTPTSVVPIQQTGTKIAEIGRQDIYSPTPTNIEANPQGTPTAKLETVTIGNTTYELSGGGGVEYSTDPIKVGKWIDGRDIWEVTLITDEYNAMMTKTMSGFSCSDFSTALVLDVSGGLITNTSGYNFTLYPFGFTYSTTQSVYATASVQYWSSSNSLYFKVQLQAGTYWNASRVWKEYATIRFVLPEGAEPPTSTT